MSSSATLAPLFEEFPPVSTDEWYEKIRDDLGDRDLADVLQWETDGVEMPALLRQTDLSGLEHLDATPSPLSTPAPSAPNGWRVRQDIAHPDVDTARRLAQTAVDRGATDLGLVPERDSSTGLPLSEPRLLTEVLGEVDLSKIRLHLEGGPTAPVLLGALLESVADPAHLRDATVAFDPVGGRARGHGPSPAEAFDLAADLTTTAPEGVRSLAVDTRVYHEAGATAVQELSYALGALSDTLSHLLDRGCSLSTTLPRLHLLVSVSPRYFVELAKLRALRLLVPQVINAYAQETDSSIRFEPDDVFVQAETSRRSTTVFAPYVNMLRTTTEAMAAVLGGCDVLSVRPHDAALRPAENFSARIARNTQLILEHESHFDAVADPAAGSYYVETLTDKLARTAWAEFQSLEASGGLLKGLQTGTAQPPLQESRDRRQQRVNKRSEVVVGTNHYPDLDETRLEDLDGSRPQKTSSDAEEDTSEPSPVPVTFADLRSAVDDASALSPVVERLSKPSPDLEPLRSIRPSEELESLRLRTERHAREQGHKPVVFLAPLGPTGPRSARATFARNFFGVAGFEIAEDLRFESPDAVAESAEEADADIVVLCSSDRKYPALTSALHSDLQSLKPPPLLVVAGNPDTLDDVSADAFIHRGSPLLDTLEQFQRRLGIADPSSR